MSEHVLITSDIATYFALRCDDVARALEVCDHLVSITSQVNRSAEPERPVAWFHLPRTQAGSVRDECFLFLSPAAVRLARDAGFMLPGATMIPRSGLPASAVLVLGEDHVDAAGRADTPTYSPSSRAAIGTTTAEVPRSA